MRLKVFTNRRNNQLLVTISRKKLGLKKRIPKFIDIDEEDFEF